MGGILLFYLVFDLKFCYTFDRIDIFLGDLRWEMFFEEFLLQNWMNLGRKGSIFRSIVRGWSIGAWAGAYPEIFRRRGFEIFLYGMENLRGGFGVFFLKNPSKLRKIPKRVGVLTPKTPPWIRPCAWAPHPPWIFLKLGTPSFTNLKKNLLWFLKIISY